MEKDLLQAVIKVEAEIQQTIEAEKKKAADWLESMRVSLSKELETQKQLLEQQYRESLAKTCHQCELEAKKDIADANQLAAHFKNLTEEALQDTVSKFLREILPKAHR